MSIKKEFIMPKRRQFDLDEAVQQCFEAGANEFSSKAEIEDILLYEITNEQYEQIKDRLRYALSGYRDEEDEDFNNDDDDDEEVYDEWS